MPAKILIVEDEPGIRDLVRQFLSPAGYVISEAEDVASLKKQLHLPAPDVLLLDLRLPDGNGLSVIPDLKKSWPAARIVILTGYGSVDAAEQAYKLDDVFLLSKPFDSEMLNAMVGLALAAGPNKSS
jgi:DNA-binding NtrC family response regulator